MRASQWFGAVALAFLCVSALQARKTASVFHGSFNPTPVTNKKFDMSKLVAPIPNFQPKTTLVQTAKNLLGLSSLFSTASLKPLFPSVAVPSHSATNRSPFGAMVQQPSKGQGNPYDPLTPFIPKK